jgi:hypothetical protein
MYEVISPKSPSVGKVDVAYSDTGLRDGHTYFVLMNDDVDNPRIRKMLWEISAKEKGEQTGASES